MTNAADRARHADIGLHGDHAPHPCGKSEMLAIPAFLRPYLSGPFDALYPEYGYDDEGRESLAIDACLAPAVRALWAAGVVTLGCCCGHSETGHGVISILAPHAMVSKEESGS